MIRRPVRCWLLPLLLSVPLLAQVAGAEPEDVLAAALAAEAAGRVDEAGRLFASACSGAPSARALALAGEFLRFRRCDLPAAEQRFREAVAAPGEAQDRAFAWRGLGEIARHHGRFDEARSAYDRSLAIQPLVQTHRSYVDLLVLARDWEGASRHSAAALALDPDDPIALLLDASLCQRAGRPEAGAAACARALTLLSCDARGRSDRRVHCCGLYNLACYHAVCGRRDEALAALTAFFATPEHRHLERSWLLADPDLEPLRADGDFRALLDRHLPDGPATVAPASATCAACAP